MGENDIMRDTKIPLTAENFAKDVFKNTSNA